MTDTVRTTAVLQTALADNQVPGSITPQIIRDMLVSLDAKLKVVADDTARGVLYPTPVGDERVFNKTSGNVERYDATVGAWVPDLLRRITPQLFGAKGDGVTDDSAAILAATNAAYATSTYPTGSTRARGEVYFPPGIYLVTSSAVFTPTVATNIAGVRFIGSGFFTSIIRYGTLAVDTWLYDNGATARAAFATYEALGFEGANPNAVTTDTDVPAHAKGFKITGGTWEQNFKFISCRFQYFDTVFDMEGTNLASEMRFFGCKIKNTKTVVYKIANVQSFNHEFYGCDVEINWGDIFSIGNPGGGGIKVYGGSWIQSTNVAATDTYFFKVTSVPLTGLGAQPVLFSGMRMELRGSHTNLVSIPDTAQIDLVFDACLFEDQTTVDKAAWCTIQGYSTVEFRGSTFYETSTGQMKFVAAGANLRGQSGTITFNGCGLPIDFSDRCSITTVNGQIRAINCRGTNVGSQAAGSHWAHDFDTHWDPATPGLVANWSGTPGASTQDGSASDNVMRLKTAQIKLPRENWPTFAEHTLKLPKSAIIKGIHIRKPAGSADATVTVMRVIRNDKTGTTHLDSNSSAMNTVHSGDVDNYFYNVGSTVNERTLRLYSTVATSGQVQGGLCLVEYY